MKQIIRYRIVACILASCPLLLAAQTNPTNATSSEELLLEQRLDAVRVYNGRALCTHRCTQTLVPGTYDLVFRGVSMQLDEATLQVQALGDGLVQSVRTRKRRIEPEDVAARRQALLLNMQAVSDSLAWYKRQRTSYEEELELLEYGQKSRLSKGLPADSLAFQLRAYRVQRNELQQLLHQLGLDERSLSTHQDELEQEVRDLKQSEWPEVQEVVVRYQTDRSEAVQLELSYLSKGADWQLRYSLHAADENPNAVRLALRGEVRNTTGLDWKQVKLSLSTGLPNVGSSVPELEPLEIVELTTSSTRGGSNIRFAPSVPVMSYDQALEDRSTGEERVGRSFSGSVSDEAGQPIVGATITLVSRATGQVITGTYSDALGNFTVSTRSDEPIRLSVRFTGYESVNTNVSGSRDNIQVTMDMVGVEVDEVLITAYGQQERGYGRYPAPKPKPALSLSDFVEPTEQALSQDYTFKQRITLENDAEPISLELASAEVNAQLAHVAVPAMSYDVFLTAQLLNWAEYVVLPAPAQVFWNKRLIGNTYLRPGKPEDSLLVSLGVDERVRVERLVESEDDTRGFGANTRTIFTMTLEVGNLTGRDIHMELLERLPISEVKSVEIEHLELAGAELDAETGFLKWQLDIQARQSRTLTVRYAIKHPKGRPVEGL